MRVETFLVYEPKDGFLYRLHPLTKVAIMFFFSIICFVLTLKANTILFAFVVFTLLLSGLSLRKILLSLKGIYFFLLLAILGNLFAVPGQQIFSIFGVSATYEGLYEGLTVAIRFVNLLMISLMVSLTTSHTELSEVMEKILQPLKYFHVNVAEIAFIASLSIRAVALIMKEVVELRKLYQARGIIKSRMSFKERLLAAYYILIPLLLLTMRRSEEVAFALYLRGYNPRRKRITLEKRKFGFSDLIFALLAVAVITLGFVLGG
jgi:energy-coupling factor transport system permease protein